jgi:glucose/arabinose dehydrogenase
MQVRSAAFLITLFLCLFTVILISGATTSAQEDGWPQIDLHLIQGNLSAPVHVTSASDNSQRLFIVEQAGRILIRKDETLLPTPFLNIGGPTGRVSCCDERGLFSIAFPPLYTQKQYFYVYYTNTAGNLVIARYHVTANADIADPNSEEIILMIPHPLFENHNGGQLAFGPKDGYLYIGTGDGGGTGDSFGNAQNPRSLLGKILRIDVESPPSTALYAIPATNPYKDNPNYAPEIWALGLRNPWRFGFDRQTGDLYIGDVGQDSYEEIDFQPASSQGGENYGWRCREGRHEYKNRGEECTGLQLTEPIAEFSHEEGCTVTGGIHYRGAQYRNRPGLYFYADDCSGQIRG